MSADMLRHLRQMDHRLARSGHHALTPKWDESFARFYEHPTARDLTVRAGRGSIKSTNAVKFAVNETLFGSFQVPPGERHFFVFVSVVQSEALQRLLLIENYLKALAIPYTRRGDTVELNEDPRGFRVLSATIGAVSGYRALGFVLDEVAKWNNDTGVNPASEILASVRAMTVTHPNARGMIVSSPLGTADLHYELVERGSTDRQVVAIGPTWEWNPSVTEEQTRALEPDPRIWAREYAALPQTGALAAFDPEAVDRAFLAYALPAIPSSRVLILDPSSGRKDTWSFGVAGWNTPALPAAPFITFDLIDGIEGKFWGQLSGTEIVSRVASQARARGVREAHADQRESLMLAAAFQAEGMRYHVHEWTAVSKPKAVEQVRRWFADGTIALPDHPKLRRELYAFEERITGSGSFTFGARGSGHDDYVSLLITLAMAEIDGALPGSPLHVPLSLASLDKYRGMLPRTSIGDLPGTSSARARDDSHSWGQMSGPGFVRSSVSRWQGH